MSFALEESPTGSCLRFVCSQTLRFGLVGFAGNHCTVWYQLILRPGLAMRVTMAAASARVMVSCGLKDSVPLSRETLMTPAIQRRFTSPRRTILPASAKEVRSGAKASSGKAELRMCVNCSRVAGLETVVGNKALKILPTSIFIRRIFHSFGIQDANHMIECTFPQFLKPLGMPKPFD